MFPKVFIITVIILLAEFSSQTIIESKCVDKWEPTVYTLYDSDGKEELTAVIQMESTDAFDPIMSFELVYHRQYRWTSACWNELTFKFGNKAYDFVFDKYTEADATCSSGFTRGEKPSNNCTINKKTNSCKWLVNVGMNPLIDNGDMEASSIDMITQPNIAAIAISTMHNYKIIADNLTELPIYQWSYARWCEYNKNIYDLDGDMITLKKEEDSFELFIYRYITKRPEKPRHVTLINSKNNSITIDCANDKDEINFWSGASLFSPPLMDRYISKKYYINRLRCGISLSLKMLKNFASFSFDDIPLKLVYKINDYDNIVIPGITFESDPLIEDEFKIETTSSTPIDDEVNNENQENDKVNPLIGVCLTIITLVKSYFDLW